MGYYSQFSVGFRIKKEFIDLIRKDIKEYSEHGVVDENNENWKDYFFYGLTIDDEGSLSYADFYQKWFMDEFFMQYLKGKVIKGTAVFDGEDNAKWGYFFDGKGKVFELRWIEELGSELK